MTVGNLCAPLSGYIHRVDRYRGAVLDAGPLGVSIAASSCPPKRGMAKGGCAHIQPQPGWHCNCNPRKYFEICFASPDCFSRRLFLCFRMFANARHPECWRPLTAEALAWQVRIRGKQTSPHSSGAARQQQPRDPTATSNHQPTQITEKEQFILTGIYALYSQISRRTLRPPIRKCLPCGKFHHSLESQPRNLSGLDFPTFFSLLFPLTQLPSPITIAVTKSSYLTKQTFQRNRGTISHPTSFFIHLEILLYPQLRTPLAYACPQK